MAGCLNRASCSLTDYSLRMVMILSLCCLRPILGDIRVTASRNGNTEWTNLTAVLKSNSSWVTKRKSLCTFKPKSLLRLSRWNCFLYIKIILSLLRMPLKSWRAVIEKNHFSKFAVEQHQFQRLWFQELCWGHILRLGSMSHLKDPKSLYKIWSVWRNCLL